MTGDGLSNTSDRAFINSFWNQTPRYILLGAASLLVISPLVLEQDDEKIMIERVYNFLIVASIWLFIVTLRELKRFTDQTTDNDHSSKTYKT